MKDKTGLFRRLEAFEKLMVAANAEATVRSAIWPKKRNVRSLGRPWKPLPRRASSSGKRWPVFWMRLEMKIWIYELMNRPRISTKRTVRR
jgi:hypothetical protein